MKMTVGMRCVMWEIALSDGECLVLSLERRMFRYARRSRYGGVSPAIEKLRSAGAVEVVHTPEGRAVRFTSNVDEARRAELAQEALAAAVALRDEAVRAGRAAAMALTTTTDGILAVFDGTADSAIGYLEIDGFLEAADTLGARLLHVREMDELPAGERVIAAHRAQMTAGQ